MFFPSFYSAKNVEMVLVYFAVIRPATGLFIIVLFQQLREKQKYLRENHAPNMRQMKMWTVSDI